jgi:hypothetical protein
VSGSVLHEQALYRAVGSCTVRLDRRTAWLARCVVSAVRDTRPQAAPMTTMQTFGNRTSFKHSLPRNPAPLSTRCPPTAL